jgi:hypothetical protein
VDGYPFVGLFAGLYNDIFLDGTAFVCVLNLEGVTFFLDVMGVLEVLPVDVYVVFMVLLDF